MQKFGDAVLGKSVEDKFKHLLDRLLEGRLIPFVGAGISRHARIPNQPDFEPTMAYLEQRARSLLNDLRDHASACDGLRYGELFNCVARRSGKERLCKALEIHRFVELAPLAAHRYIAYLAREGLLSDIFTTNYDCCVERAFIGSIGAPSAGGFQNVDDLKTIFDGRTYRDHGRLRWTDQGNPTLIVHKINGCARAYAAGEQPASGILLTDAELESFGERQWARDGFAVVFRTSTLLVCAFSADEHQFRFKVLELLKENAPESSVGQPFFVTHRSPGDREEEIITAALRIEPDPNGPTLREKIDDRLLCGDDAKAMGCDGQRTLQADCFFERLFHGAIGRLLQRYAGPSADLRQALAYAVPASDLWFNRLLERLYPGADDQDPLSPIFGRYRDTLFAIPRLAGCDSQPDPGPMPFWRWVWAVYHPEQPCPNDYDWYLPLRTDHRGILLLLLLLVTLEVLKSPREQVRPIVGLGLLVRPDAGKLDAQVQPAWPGLVVVREGIEVPTQPIESPMPIDPGRLLLRVTLPTGPGGGIAQGRWQTRHRRADDTAVLATGRYFTIGIEALLTAARTPDRLNASIVAAYARAPAPAPKAKLRRL